MTMKTMVRKRRDRWADWAVVGVLVIALLLGWVVMALAESSTETFTANQASLTVHYPTDWLIRESDEVAFRAIDPASGAFKTTYEVQVVPIQATENPTPTLSVALNNASLARAGEYSAYRLFDVVRDKDLDGQPTMEATYVFVQKGSDLFRQDMPIVVLGLDIAVTEGERAYIFSLMAAEENFGEAEKDFRKFVRKAETW